MMSLVFSSRKRMNKRGTSRTSRLQSCQHNSFMVSLVSFLSFGYRVVARTRSLLFANSTQVVPSGADNAACAGDFYIAPDLRHDGKHFDSPDFDSQIDPSGAHLKKIATSSTALAYVGTTAEESPVCEVPPTSQAQLNTILEKMVAEPNDEFGKLRMAPDLAVWRLLGEKIPLLVNGKYKLQQVRFEQEHLYESEVTTVYNVVNRPDIVIRYHKHRHSALTPIDTTVVDFWFLRRLQHTGLVARVHYFSAALNPNVYERNGTPVWEPAPYGKVKNPAGPKSCGVRYTVLEKVGPSVQSYFKSRSGGRLPFVDAIKLGGQMIMLLEKLHAYNYTHGDAHMGNFAVHNNKLIFIDFGYARIIVDSELSRSSATGPHAYWYHPTLSAWEVRRCQASYRDDVYRVLQGMVITMYGMPYLLYLDHLCANKVPPIYAHTEARARFVDIKQKGAIFEIPAVENDPVWYPEGMKTSFALSEMVPERALPCVRALLASIMAHLLTVEIAEKPDYNQIKQGLAEILLLVAQLGSESSNLMTGGAELYTRNGGCSGDNGSNGDRGTDCGANGCVSDTGLNVPNGSSVSNVHNVLDGSGGPIVPGGAGNAVPSSGTHGGPIRSSGGPVPVTDTSVGNSHDICPTTVVHATNTSSVHTCTYTYTEADFERIFRVDFDTSVRI